jgi:hypothetical protein
VGAWMGSTNKSTEDFLTNLRTSLDQAKTYLRRAQQRQAML